MSNFFDTTEVSVEVSYPEIGIKEPMRFHLALLLSKEDKAIRQKFFALTDEEQAEKQQSHNLELLASLTTRMPENVPGFEADQFADAKEAVRSYLGGTNQMKAKLVADVIARYWSIIQPAEFFR